MKVNCNPLSLPADFPIALISAPRLPRPKRPRPMHLNAKSVRNASRLNPAGHRALSANLALNAPRVKIPRRVKRAPNLPNVRPSPRSEEHTSELQSLMRNPYDVLCLKNKKKKHQHH